VLFRSDEEIKADVLKHGVDSRGVLTQRYGSDALDASLLLVVLTRFLPADDPRFVVGIMLDEPNYSGGPPEGRSAAPLFHEIASYLAQRYTIPLSKEASPVVPLIAE
jgi:cell division protein FtsI/penicillin-binding protein 2